MLRLILSIAGVGLIVLGLFGGRPLDNMYNQLTGSTDKDASVAIGLSDRTAENIDTAAAAVTLAEQNAESIVQPAAQSVVVEAPQPTAPQPTEESKATLPVVATQNPTQNPIQNPESDTSSEIMVAVSDPVIATAADQAPASQLQAQQKVVATDAQKASDRNDQVKLAKTILTSSTNADSIVVGDATKDQEVQEVLATSTGLTENVALVVVKDKVNLREGPSIDHPIVLQLEVGQQLMEFRREGRWVNVGAYGTEGKIGWVHQRLVSDNEK